MSFASGRNHHDPKTRRDKDLIITRFHRGIGADGGGITRSRRFGSRMYHKGQRLRGPLVISIALKSAFGNMMCLSRHVAGQTKSRHQSPVTHSVATFGFATNGVMRDFDLGTYQPARSKKPVASA